MQSNLKNGAIYRVIKNGTSLNGDSIAAIGLVWKDLNLNWLMLGEGEMLMDASLAGEPSKEYSSEDKTEITWCEEALKRADDQIALQRDMINTLKQIIEKQEKAAKDAGIDL